MVDPSVPERLRWAVQLLDIAPADEILEIGPGPGVSVSLVCEQLADGHITAIDRSATAVQRATKRNADHVASGKAVVHQLIKDLLGPGGVVHLVYESPGKQQASRVAEAVTAALANRGFATASTMARSPSLLCISGRLSHHAQPRR
jgi:trans-aconitate methyltransferase